MGILNAPRATNAKLSLLRAFSVAAFALGSSREQA